MSTRHFMAGITIVVLLSGCMDTFVDIRREMMKESLLHCTSLFQAKVGDSVNFQAGFEATSFTYASDVQKYWNGILADKEFRKELREAGIDPIEFQKSVSECQRDWLERDGYFDIIRPS